jgi:co-chaperonin GroES (HSP10)
MNIKPLGTKVVIKIKKSHTKSVGNKELIIKTESPEYTRFYLENAGINVELNEYLGEELRLFSNAHINIHKEDPETGIIDKSEIWAIIDR